MHPYTYSGDLIKRCRMKLGVSQRKLARALSIASSSFTRYETGQRIPPQTVWNNLAILMGGKPGDDLERLVDGT